jgi:N-acetylated-alpha-linked acidic dipeptidase
MKAFWAAAIVAISIPSLGGATPNALRGYSTVETQRELLTESLFVDIPSAENAREEVATFAARPHYAGTPADYALALEMRNRMRAAGIAAEIESFTALVDTPRELVLELAPDARAIPAAPQLPFRKRRPAFPIALNLAEAAEPADAATAQRSIGLPFNAGSGDGDVSAPLVYANYGRESAACWPSAPKPRAPRA